MLLVVQVVAPSAAARAEEPSWHFRRFQPYEYTLTANAAIGALALTLYGTPPQEPRWAGGILFDDAVRDAVRIGTRAGRDVVARVSDVILIGLVAYPVLVDSLVVGGLVHDDSDLALQMSVVSFEAFALMRLLNDVTKLVIGRERPYNRECARDPNYADECRGSPSTYQSFISGHTIGTFTAAFLTCAHHAFLPLYGEPWDAVVCGGALTLATATGFMRILSDNHYLSDVAAGAALGAVAGFLVPWLLHYRHDTTDVARTSAALRSRAAVALPVVAFPWP